MRQAQRKAQREANQRIKKMDQNLLLELVRLRINRCDDPRAYASELRRHIAAHSGAVPRRYRHVTDPMRYDAQRQRYVRTSSLRR